MSDPTATLEKRHTPRQARSERTVDTILQTTARLLQADGFEALSTNKVAKAAGMTPPALYRYFPNKYALLKELAERLMARQNAALAATEIDPDALEESLVAVLQGQLDVTMAQSGGGWIMRSLHAAPMLSAVRIASHEQAALQLTRRFAATFPEVPAQDLRRKMRLAVELGYAGLEYLFDLPNGSRETAIRDLARLLALHFQDIL